MLGKAMGATLAIGADVVEERIELAKKLGLVDVAINSRDHDKALEEIKAATEGKGCEVTIDASGNPAGRFLGIQGTRQWGRFAFVGEGNTVTFEPSRDVMHKQLTLYGALGDQPRAHGRPGGAPGALEDSPGRHRHAHLPAGEGGRRLPTDGFRASAAKWPSSGPIRHWRRRLHEFS